MGGGFARKRNSYYSNEKLEKHEGQEFLGKLPQYLQKSIKTGLNDVKNILDGHYKEKSIFDNDDDKVSSLLEKKRKEESINNYNKNKDELVFDFMSNNYNIKDYCDVKIENGIENFYIKEDCKLNDESLYKILSSYFNISFDFKDLPNDYRLVTEEPYSKQTGMGKFTFEKISPQSNTKTKQSQDDNQLKQVIMQLQNQLTEKEQNIENLKNQLKNKNQEIQYYKSESNHRKDTGQSNVNIEDIKRQIEQKIFVKYIKEFKKLKNNFEKKLEAKNEEINSYKLELYELRNELKQAPKNTNTPSNNTRPTNSDKHPPTTTNLPSSSKKTPVGFINKNTVMEKSDKEFYYVILDNGQYKLLIYDDKLKSTYNKDDFQHFFELENAGSDSSKVGKIIKPAIVEKNGKHYKLKTKGKLIIGS